MAVAKNISGTKFERRALQGIVAILSLIPIGAGAAGAIAGVGMIVPGIADVSLGSHFRYLSGLLLAIGLGFWSAIPSIEKKTARFRMLTFIVFIGGLARLAGLVLAGVPALPMIGGMAMELLVTPLLCLWQYRIARAGR